MSVYGSLFDSSESNKENIPFPHLVQHHDKMPAIVLPPTRREDFDTDSFGSPSLSQMSNASSNVLFNSPGVSAARDSCDEMDAESEDGELVSRKEKSLGLLCQRFLVAMNEETRDSIKKEVHLETVARKMCVEKRRIYDIVNVMEALDAMNKTNKSFYCWHGLSNLPRLMAELQREAVVEKLPERVLRVEQAMCSFTELSPGSKVHKEAVGSLQEDVSLGCDQMDMKKSRVDQRDRQGRNSLAQLCRRFLMVLLSNPKNTRRVSLDVASTVLIKDPETEGFEPPSRSRCRRLYDIANVLVALGLIKKVHYLFGTKKIPLFVYCGPEPDDNGTYDANACLERMLTSSSSAPQTPQMKATTAAMVQSLTIGKRSQSDANLTLSLQQLQQKMPRIKSEDFHAAAATSSLMMFAELAAERLRQEKYTYQPRNSPSRALPVHPKPQAQKSADDYANHVIRSPGAAVKRFPMPGMVLPPTNPLWTQLIHTSFNSPLSKMTSLPPSPMTSSPKPAPAKHSVSNILGTSNKHNISNSLDHKQSSPFQVVQKPRPRTVFGAVHNIPGSY